MGAARGGSAGSLADRGHLETEGRLGASRDLDAMGTLEILAVINNEDQRVAHAVRERIGAIGALVEMVVEAQRGGGRMVTIGAGTSGRLGVLDASELPPTFSADPDRWVAVIAGGDAALRRSSEHREDERDGAHGELDRLGVGAGDVVLGIAAGGSTAFVLGGVEEAKARGAGTALLVCCAMERPAWCDVLIDVVTGAEVVTGSTRMKAGTATKLVLNMVTTASMVRMGKVYGNLMVDLRATNEKLRDRGARIIAEVTGLGRGDSIGLLDAAGRAVTVALEMHARSVGAGAARGMLADRGGDLRAVIGDPR